ncbi:hypothetical protein DFH28DRAFT_825437, partial [Melampsora americana]
ADSSDEEQCDNDIVENNLWPVFYARDQSKPVIGKRKNKACGHIKGYRKPLVNTENPEKKLKPAPVSKQTKHNWKLKHDKAVGKNAAFLGNWLATANPSLPPTTPPLDDVCDVDVQANEESSDIDNNYDESDECAEQNKHCSAQKEHSLENSSDYNIQIDSCVSRYRDSVKKTVTKPDLKQRVDEEWEELNKAITNASAMYKEKQKRDPKFSYPHLELADLREFNALRKELKLSGAKSPSITASVLTALSSARRNDKPHPQFSSGRSRVRKIRFQANHLIEHQELSFSKTGL